MKARFLQVLLLISFMVLVMAVSNIIQTSVAAQTPPDPIHLISLQYGDIDTRMGEPVLPSSLRIDTYRPDEAGYYLVQFEDVILPEWRTALEAAGAEPLGYIPNNAFIVRMTEAQRTLVTHLQPVQWVGIYHPAYRIAPWIPPQDEGEATLTVLTFPGADLKQIVAQLEAGGGGVLATAENEFGGTVRIAVDLGNLAQIAQINGVMWIEPWIEPQLTNDVARGIMDVEDTVWNTHGLYGAGQIIAVADTGLDVGQNDLSMSDDFEGRIVSAYCRGRENPCDWSDPHGHGTHVAGSAVGNGHNSGSDPSAHDYAGSYAGIAPEAQLVFQSTMSDTGSLSGLPVDLNILFQQTYDDGARVHNNSWGQGTGPWGTYNAYSFQADQFVWSHPDMVVLFSAGNNGVDADGNGVVDQDSTGWPGTAKNVITVGATENLRDNGGYNPDGICETWGGCWGLRFPADPIQSDQISDSSDGLAAFSSRGPVDGDRIKPDVVAPGTNILSARTHQYTLNMDVESGAIDWTAEAPWHITDLQAHSGTHSFGTGPYGNNQNVSLTSPVIDIRTGAGTIGFWTQYDLGLGDTGHVEYNDGTGWTACHTRDTQGNQVTIAGTQNDWTFIFCLVPRRSQTQNFQFRFRLESNSILTGDGWFIDDIRVAPSGWGYDYQAGVPNEHYMYMGGTSMATPLVAGSATLAREHYMGRGHVPSAALVKATLINGTTNIAPGQYGIGATQEITDTRPNNVTGWGRVNLQESLFPAAPQTILYQDIANADGLNTNDTHVYHYEVSDSAVPFRATLVWTDYPGAPPAGNSHINHDLDLLARMPNGSLLYPSGRTNRDADNNTEDIFLGMNDVITGTYVITVTGHSVPNGPQGYALVVRGGNLSLASLDILQPTGLALGNAGPHDNPHKIIIRVTKPLSGLTKRDFEVRIGGITLPQQSIITFYEGSDEYVLEIQPPNQPANGSYSLTVTTGNFIDTEQSAILYADASNVDVALVIDRSGSMGYSDYMEPAKDAAKQFVDFMHDNDKIGVVSFSSSATVDYGLTTITPASGGGPAFSDDMESGTSKWTADSPWAQITSDYHSATHSWTDSPGGDYSNNVNVSLTSIPFSLASIANPTLSFWTHYAIESYYDEGYVEISTNGGASWTTLTYYDGTQTSWVNKQVSLAAYAGQPSVQIRFRLDTDYSVTYDGWYIDDVEVIPGSTKEEAKSAIDAISSSGTTSIGDGLQDGQSELTSKGEATHPWAMVLLSDGYENTAPYVADVLPAIKSTKTIIHSVALGSDSDEALLMDIASQTGGMYSMAPTADQLAGIYNTIAGAVSGQQILFSETGVAQQGVTDVKSVVVDSTVSGATFSVSWSNSASDIDLTLQKPNGSIIDPTVAASDPNIDYVSGSTYEYYRIKSPTLVAGVWKMRITGGSISSSAKGVIATAGGEPYTAMVTGQSGLTLHSYLYKSSYLTFEPIKISASLSDNQPILGATVTVDVQPPSAAAALIRASEWIEVNGDTLPDPERVAEIKASTVTAASTMTLYDDGAHGDGQANDGVYANTLSGSSTHDAGTYVFTVRASGTSNTGEAFTRQSENSVYVATNPNPPSPTYLPIIFKAAVPPTPDLIVEQITATSNNVEVVIKNIGDAPVTDAFWVDVYIDPNPVPTHVNQIWTDLSSQGLVWGVDTSIAANGGTFTLTMNDAYYYPEWSNFSTLPEGTPVYAQVDSVSFDTTYGGVLERHEITGGAYNNIAHTLSVLSTGAAEPAAGAERPSVSTGSLPPR